MLASLSNIVYYYPFVVVHTNLWGFHLFILSLFVNFIFLLLMHLQSILELFYKIKYDHLIAFKVFHSYVKHG